MSGARRGVEKYQKVLAQEEQQAKFFFYFFLLLATASIICFVSYLSLLYTCANEINLLCGFSFVGGTATGWGAAIQLAEWQAASHDVITAHRDLQACYLALDREEHPP